MVFKEDCVLWFKDLDSFERIDVLYELLNMCLPFELRFLGSCVEELGKHTYEPLRGPTIFANDLEKLSKDAGLNQSLLDDSVRHRILIYLSLLSTKNYSVANWLYNNHLRTDWIEDFVNKINVKSDNVLSEFLLMYTMASHHPAFTFAQKLFFEEILARLLDCKRSKRRLSPRPSIYGYPPGFGFPVPKNAMPMQGGEINFHQQPPHGVQQVQNHQQPPFDYVSMFCRPGFHCGAPEQMPPFSQQPPTGARPLSQPNTPPPPASHSRSSSPHRTPHSIRNTPRMPPPPQSMMQMVAPPPDLLSPPPQMVPPPSPSAQAQQQIGLLATPTQDQLSHSSLQATPIFAVPPPPYVPDMVGKLPEEEIQEGGVPNLDTPWIMPDNLKPLNGMCFSPFPPKMGPTYIVEQMSALNLEGENAVHRSDSSSSSSVNQSPEPEAVAPHGPGRGGDSAKPRLNGMFMPGCDTPTFNNVPYPANFMQNRSIFQYSQPFARSPFNANFQGFPPNSDTSVAYTLTPYPLMYSSPPYPAPPRPPPTCFNCGAAGHLGNDCTSQNIQDITQKQSYSLEYNATLPEEGSE